MMVELQPTNTLRRINGVLVRRWHAYGEGSIQFDLWVSFVGVLPGKSADAIGDLCVPMESPLIETIEEYEEDERWGIPESPDGTA